MGHDIAALKAPFSSLEEVENYTGEETPIVAYFFLHAFDQNNDLIYRALDAEDYYAGVSGNRQVAQFTLSQITQADTRLRQLASSLGSVSRESLAQQHAKEEIIEKVKAMSATGTCTAIDEPSLIDEPLQFINSVTAYMNSNQLGTISIYFG